MDYEKRYKEALKWMQSLYSGLHGATKEEAEHYFPELLESEDERIRKAIKKALQVRCDGSRIISDEPVTLEEAIAWLEKQGEQKHIINVPPREVILSIWDLGNEWKELTNGCILPEYGTQLDYIQKHWHESEYYLKANQDEKKELKKIESKTLDADNVIAWLVANDFDYYAKLFKKDFGL